ncbi:multidrug and toxin extrusion protein 2-like [Liolophura sinensis]|uniref:multidrug and toxin extrusion protein 2-like n=1 Tax=Liolophura sinensis TaxID=3198878 RepID=UPI0031599269
MGTRQVESQVWTESQPVSGSESQDSMKALGGEFTVSNYSSSCEDGLSPSQEDTPSLSMSEFSSHSNSATVPLITAAACSPLPVCPQPNTLPPDKASGYGGKGVHKRKAHRDTRPWFVRHLSTWRQHIPSSFKKECKLVVDIAWPVVVTQFLQFTLQLTSAVFCGHLGEIYLDAIALGNLVVNTCGTSVLIGLGCACDTLFAQTFGSANKKKMGLVLQRGLLILLLSCLPCWALLINTENLLSRTGQDKHIARLAGQFAMVSIPVLPGEAIHLVLTKYLHSQSIVVPSMVIFFVVNLANFGLHAVLIFGLGLGVVGAAISVSLSHWLVCILHVIFIKLSRVYKSTWDGWKVGCFHNWWDFLKLALPGLFMVCLQWWCFEIFTVLAGLLGPEELAAHSIVYQLGAFLYMVPLGVSVSVCIRVGNCLGAGNPTAAINTAKAAMGLVVAWSIVMAALFLVIKDYCSYAFTNDRWVGEVASSLVPIMCLLQIGDAIQCVGAGVVLGCGNQRLGAAINLVSYYCLATPLASILMFKTSLRIVGAWWGLALCTTCQAIAFSLVLLKTDWQKTTIQVQIHTGVKNMCLTNHDDPGSVIFYPMIESVDPGLTITVGRGFPSGPARFLPP